jgi:small toxic polypeptide LdrA/B/C/D
MSYALLSIAFLAIAAAVAIVARRRRPPGHASALALTAAGLVVLTVVFDSLMIAAALFAYDESQLLGVRLWLTPLEDLAYPIAALLLCSAVWNLTVDRSGARA